MGRASKLKAQRKVAPDKTPTYNFSLAQLNQMRDEAVDKAVGEALEWMFGLPAMVLTDKFGFTADQLDKFIDEVSNLYDSVCKGYLSLDDIRNSLYEECGARIKELSKVRKHSWNKKSSINC